MERKGQQSFQGVVYARLIAFGNGGLHALYDKTDGFYRRQLILTTKDKVDGREDDPYLIDKLRKERDGIFFGHLKDYKDLFRIIMCLRRVWMPSRIGGCTGGGK